MSFCCVAALLMKAEIRLAVGVVAGNEGGRDGEVHRVKGTALGGHHKCDVS